MFPHLYSPVKDLDRLLPLVLDPTSSQFNTKSLLINGFKETRAEGHVHRDCGLNNTST